MMWHCKRKARAPDDTYERLRETLLDNLPEEDREAVDYAFTLALASLGLPK